MRWGPFQIALQPLHVAIEVKAERSDVAFDGIAVVAEQPAGTAAIMAMVRAWVAFASALAPTLLHDVKRAFAYGASAVLRSEKTFEHGLIHAGPELSRARILSGEGGWVSFERSPIVLFALLVGITLFPLSAAGFYIGTHVVGPAALLGFIGLVVGFACLNPSLAVARVIRAGLSQIPFPLLGRAIRFSHWRTTMKPTRNLTSLSWEHQA